MLFYSCSTPVWLTSSKDVTKNDVILFHGIKKYALRVNGEAVIQITIILCCSREEKPMRGSNENWQINIFKSQNDYRDGPLYFFYSFFKLKLWQNNKSCCFFLLCCDCLLCLNWWRDENGGSFEIQARPEIDTQPA